MKRRTPASAAGPRHGVARVLSKRGLCSRTVAAQWVKAGRVRVNGKLVRDPEHPVHAERDSVEVDELSAAAQEKIYLVLNKPRGLVTTARDERGRPTVYRCFDGADLPWVAPVGRLDQASEGMLLFTNDPAWAARVTSQAKAEKVYHVQVNCIPSAAQLSSLQVGVVDSGERLVAKAARLLRHGQRNAWLEIVLDEGRNRQIRRLLAAMNIDVLRLVRVSIAGVPLGDLGKGKWRRLIAEEVGELGGG